MVQQRTAEAPHRRTGTTPTPPVVVGVDGSWAARRALDQAALEAERRATGLVIVTVIRPPWAGHDAPDVWLDADRDAADAAREVNDAAQQQVRDTQPHLAVDGVVTSSVAELSRLGAGLLVLGRWGVGGQGVFRMGTTSSQLVRGLGCPVLVCRDERLAAARPAHPALRRPEVVAAVHVPAETPTVLDRAIEEATLRGMALCVFSQVGDLCLGAGGSPRPETSVPWRVVETSGHDTADAILRYTDRDDLLVLGNRGRERLAGHVMGSVSRAVLDRMTCDVMLVPVGPTHPSRPSRPSRP